MTSQDEGGLLTVVNSDEGQLVTIGTRIRHLRQAKEISAEVLAVRAGVSSSTLGRLERADIVPNLRILERIAAELGTTAPELLSDAQEVVS